MSIGSAVQKGSLVYAYDIKGRQLIAKTGELHGYTSATLSVRKGSMIYTYDEKGRQISATLSR